MTPEWLLEHVTDPDVRVIDFRWYLDGRDGPAAYRAGHIPGAVFLDLADVTGETGPGRHPLPSPERFAAALRAAGVSRSTRVVAYDDATSIPTAARLWWLLRHFGHAQAAVLDGGIQAWPGTLERGDEPPPAPGDFQAAEPLLDEVVDAERVRDRAPETILIDARAPERYRGETEPVDPRAGHIRGALSAPWDSNLSPDGRMRSPEELRRRFAELGIAEGQQVIAYCGSGVSASHDLLALEVAGLPGGRLYEGSWSDWSRRDDLPAATGAVP